MPQQLSRRITARSRSDQISDILRDDILRGQYRPGERLPSERDLCARFDASRGAVREAFKRLEQLGIAAIHRGGARVVPIDSCTLDVLGPLLDLNDLPDAKLVDEVLQMLGTLMDLAARLAVEKATDDELAHAQRIIDELLSQDGDGMARHEGLRRLGSFFIDVADHLVLKLTANGLRTTFMSRMVRLELRPGFEGREFREVAEQLRAALTTRNATEVGQAMRRLNRIFRNSARTALAPATRSEKRISA